MSAFCDDCGGKDVEYYQEISTPDADYTLYYCKHCLFDKYKDYLREVKSTAREYGDPLPGFKEFLNLENYKEL